MTREEKVAEAQRMRSQGATYKRIAERFGISVATAHRWSDPARLERDRETSLAWKERQKRSCPSCGATMDYTRQDPDDLCAECKHEAEYGEQNREIERLWNEGQTGEQIAETLGITADQVRGRVERLRERNGSELALHRERNRHLWDEIIFWRGSGRMREQPMAQGTPNRPCSDCGVVYDWNHPEKHDCRAVSPEEQVSFERHRKRQEATMRRLIGGAA